MPRKSGLLASVAGWQRQLAIHLQDSGRLQEADKTWRQCIATWERLLVANPLNPRWRQELVLVLDERGQPNEAEQHFEKAIALLEEAIRLKPVDGTAHNNLAWLLATRTNPKFRDPIQAVKLAPLTGGWWNTLGAAQYRAGDWKAAVAALEESMRLRKGGHSLDWFFLAIARWQMDQKDEARKWYDQVIQWMEKDKPEDEELRRFRAEAAELLGIKEEPKE